MLGQELLKMKLLNLDFLKILYASNFRGKIVAHADNLITGDKEVGVDFVINKWKYKIKTLMKILKD